MAGSGDFENISKKEWTSVRSHVSKNFLKETCEIETFNVISRGSRFNCSPRLELFLYP